jgi:uncharacterized membrane protein
LSLVGLVLAVAAPARAVTVPINFDGTEQSFDATIDLTGNLFADGSGAVVNTKAKIEPFKFTAPLNHPLALFGGPVTISSDPKTDPLGTNMDFSSGTQLVDINDLDVDFLNGQTADFALDTIFLTTNSTVSLLKSISIDVSGTLTGLRFDQTGAAVVLGGPGSGTFAVNGDLSANIDNLLAVVFGLLQVPVGTQSITLPGALTGSWTSTQIAGPLHKIELDGVIDLNVPISLLTNLTTSITDVLSLTISSTVDLAASLTVSVAYNLEDTFVIPEPSSIVLLGLGLCAAMLPAARKLRRRK